MSSKLLFRCKSKSTKASVLPKPNLDFKSILEHRDVYAEAIRHRKLKPDNLDFVVTNRSKELLLLNELNELKHSRNKLSKQIPNASDKSSMLSQLTELKPRIKHLESQYLELCDEMVTKCELIPNLVDATSPLVNEIDTFINCKSETDAVAALPPLPKDHKTIGEQFNLVNFSQASKVSGASWYYLINDGALLEQALINYSLAKARAAGYLFVIPPSIVQNDIIAACGYKPNDQNNEQQIYGLDNLPMSLIGTSEIPLGGLHAASNFPPGQKFPIKYVGLSRSFRAEAGARGKDTKGLYRVHEFTKVELFHFTDPLSSQQELEHMKQLQIDIIQDLGIQAKVLNIARDDLGAPAVKKYDIEAWMPGRNDWGELTSCSNCTDYQSRRLSTRFYDSAKNLHYVHTLNGTAMAVPRVIIAIIEQFYDADNDRIAIPKPLQPYMDNREYIVPNL